MNPTKQIRYLVQSSDGSLHGYDREDILVCDLATNKEDPPVQIFRLSDTALTIRYDPIAAGEIKESLAVTVPSTTLRAVPAELAA